MDFDAIAFADLTYNEAANTYDYTKTEASATLTYSFFFENGKLLKVTASMNSSSEYYSMQMLAEVTVSNIGTTAVTVPTVDKAAE